MNFHATASDMFELLDRGECSRAFAYTASRGVTAVSVLETYVILSSSDRDWSDKRQILESRQPWADKKSRRGIGAIPHDGVLDTRFDMRMEHRRFAEALLQHVASTRRPILLVEVHTKGAPQPSRPRPPVENVFA